MSISPSKVKVALVGARGYAGKELLELLLAHPYFELAVVTSRQNEGRSLKEVLGLDSELRFVNSDPAIVKEGIGIWVLALPNGLSEPWVKAIRDKAPGSKIIDFSADHRNDKAWTYGLPERHREAIEKASYIANPGCYATGATLGLLPLLSLLRGNPHVFGLSGFSGAGTTPSPRNDPKNLEDNVLPYALLGHSHEAEISRELGQRVHFSPHVTSFFRGMSLTIHAPLEKGLDRESLYQSFEKFYAHEPMVKVQRDIPSAKEAAHDHRVTLGGFDVDPETGHAVLVASLDNLLKGASSQCLQNMNLMAGYDEDLGLKAKDS